MERTGGLSKPAGPFLISTNRDGFVKLNDEDCPSHVNLLQWY